MLELGTDQNIEIEIFSEYKYTLNELLVLNKNCFSIRLIVCKIWRTRVFTGSEIVWRAAYFRSEFLETCFRWLRQYKRSMLPQFLTSCRQIWQAYKIIAEDENRPGEFWSSTPIIFLWPKQCSVVCWKREIFFKCLQKIKHDFNQKSPERNKSANGTKTDKQNTNSVNWSWQPHWHLEVNGFVWIMKLAFVYKQKYFKNTFTTI